MNVVIDANVAIAAVASRGLCEAIVELCLEHHQIVISEDILADIEGKLQKKLKVSDPVVSEFIRLLRSNATICVPERLDRSICRDPDDVVVLGLVVPGKAEVIITGDKDLLILKKHGTARILSPREFWERNKK